MKVLFITSILPFRRRNGGEVCSLRLLKQLSEHVSELVVVGRGDAKDLSCHRSLAVHSLAPAPTEFANMSRAHKLSSLLGSILNGRAWTSHRMLEDILPQLRKFLEKKNFDCVVVDHLQVYEWYRTLKLRTPAILMAHNVEPSVYGDLIERTNNVFAKWVLKREQRQLERTDIAVLQRVGGIACLTDSDRQYYLDLSMKTKSQAAVEVLPSYFDPEGRIRKETVKSDTFNGRQPWRIGILGTWTWESNRLGIEWFLREVLPLIHPDCEIFIAGKGLDANGLPSRVNYLGFVDSARKFYESCDVVAIPSIAGGGIQEKTIEAIGLALPLVVTSTAMRGIDSFPSFVNVVDTAAGFASACSRIREFDPEQAWKDASSWNDERVGRYRKAVRNLISSAVSKPGL